MISFFLLVIFFPLSLADCPPATVYESTFNKCYKAIYKPTSFLTAEQYCQGIGGHLVALRNGFETSFVSGIIAGQGSPSSSSYWIGANYLSAPTWAWTYNTTFSYSNWAPGQPADPSINQCGAVRDFDNYWTKELCSSLKPFVCSIDPNAAPVGSPTCPPTPTWTTTSTGVSTSCPPEPTGNLTCSGRCPADYTMSPIDCKCYKWYPISLMIFSSAQNFCQAYNGTLVKITSAAQNKWLADFLANQGLTAAYPWIGLTCPGPSKDSCYWTDGSLLSCYDNFDTLEFPKDQNWNGSNPHLFIRLDNSMDDYGMWFRCGPEDDKCFLNVVCMQDS